MINKMIEDRAANETKKVVCFILPENSSAIEVVKEALTMNLCSFSLYGNEGRIKKAIQEVDSSLESKCQIIDCEDHKIAV